MYNIEGSFYSPLRSFVQDLLVYLDSAFFNILI